MTLCETFKRRSSSSWNLLSKARKVDTQLLEETLTDVNLLELKVKHPGEVITETFTKPREGQTGADWEWWFTGASGLWLGFRVQAKIIRLQSGEYEHLHYKNPHSAFFQSDLLIQSALSNSPPLIPLYCLYSNWHGRRVSTSWPCGTFKRNVRNYGCSLISAFSVKYLRAKGGAKDLKSVLPYMRPWHCLVCCEGFGMGDLPQRAFSYWEHKVKSSEREILTSLDAGVQADITGAQSNFLGLYENIQPVQNPPNYVIRLLEGLPIEAPDESLRHITIFRELGQLEVARIQRRA
jgi:hypothetical protein